MRTRNSWLDERLPLRRLEAEPSVLGLSSYVVVIATARDGQDAIP
ncbi:hypothetical protein [Nonomuraea turcica]|nr:hypothetical protein [Nonomuraea sp. G32]MDP4511942.1 hypothetical protein [Nonomuraea sp. G32]